MFMGAGEEKWAAMIQQMVLLTPDGDIFARTRVQMLHKD